MIQVSEIKIAFLDEILGDVGLSYNVEKTKLTTIASLANKKQRSEAKFLTMIPITFKMKAPFAFMTEFDTMKVGVRRWSSSVMHSILKNGLKPKDFENENEDDEKVISHTIEIVEKIRRRFKDGDINKEEAKKRIKKAIPGNFYYTSRITMSYENLRQCYHDRINHELDWWQQFLKEFEKTIPFYEQFIKGEGFKK